MAYSYSPSIYRPPVAASRPSYSYAPPRSTSSSSSASRPSYSYNPPRSTSSSSSASRSWSSSRTSSPSYSSSAYKAPRTTNSKSSISSKASSMLSSLKSSLSSFGNAVKKTAVNVSKSVASTVKNVARTVKSAAAATVKNISYTATNVAKTVVNTAAKTASSVKQTASTYASNLSKAAASVASSAKTIASTVKSTAVSVSKSVASTVSKVADTVKSTASSVANTYEKAVYAFADKVDKVANVVKKAADTHIEKAYAATLGKVDIEKIASSVGLDEIEAGAVRGFFDSASRFAEGLSSGFTEAAIDTVGGVLSLGRSLVELGKGADAYNEAHGGQNPLNSAGYMASLGAGAVKSAIDTYKSNVLNGTDEQRGKVAGEVIFAGATFLAGSSLVTGVKATGVIGATDDIAKAAANSVDDVAKAAANSVDDVAGAAGNNVKNIKELADQIKSNNGLPLPGCKGGKTYENIPREPGSQRLPDGASYKEYDVNPKIAGQNRGAERLVLGDDGSIWYTDDHYKTFKEVK